MLRVCVYVLVCALICAAQQPQGAQHRPLARTRPQQTRTTAMHQVRRPIPYMLMSHLPPQFMASNPMVHSNFSAMGYDYLSHDVLLILAVQCIHVKPYMCSHVCVFLVFL